MSVDKNNADSRVQIQIPRTYAAAFAAAFFALLFLFSCLHALGLPAPYNVLSAMSGFNLLHIAVSSVGIVYLADMLRRKIKKLAKPELGIKARNFLRLCVCVLTAFLLEITVLQYNHYGTADGYADIFNWNDLSTSMRNVSPNPNSPVFLGNTSQNDGEEPVPPVIEFDNLNRRVASVRIEPYFDAASGYEPKTMSCYIMFTDEQLTDCYTPEYTIVKNAPFTEYIPIYAIGKVSKLTVVFTSGYSAFTNAAVNDTIPLTPVSLRIIIIAGLIFVIGTIRRYNIFAVRFNAGDKRQNAVFACVLAVFAAYCCFLSASGYMPDISDYGGISNNVYRWEDQYNYLGGALAHGKLDIDVGFDASGIVNFDRPYDMSYRLEKGVEYPHDTVMYNGKFYVYFGVVPAVLLYLPFNLITGGGRLPNWIVTFVFGSATVIFLSLAWREIVKRLFPKISYITFMLGVFAVSFGSFAPYRAVKSAQYQVAELSGLAFISLGIYLLFKFAFSDKKRFIVLTSACLSLALAVGCRPTLVFWSVFVPILVWGEVKDKNTRLKTVLAVAAPYAAIAFPLMWYNYARFGSITEFGVSYMLTNSDFTIRTSEMTPIEYIYCVIGGSIEGYYFKLPRITEVFPFVGSYNIQTAANHIIAAYGTVGIIGIFSVPIIWYFAKIRSVSGVIREKDARLKTAFIAGASAFFIISLMPPIVGAVNTNYASDFYWFAFLSALIVICALLYKHADSAMGGFVEKSSAAAILMSGLLGLGSTFIGDSAAMKFASPDVFIYLQRATTFFAGT